LDGGASARGAGPVPRFKPGAVLLLAVAAVLFCSCASPRVATRTIVPGKEYEAAGARYKVLEAASGYSERGVASWYGADFHGRATASGEPYDMDKLTAAHRILPLGTVVRVRRVDGRGEAVVRVNDRGPFAKERVIDLSRAAARKLGMIEAGTAEVTVEALEGGRDFTRGDFTLQLGSFAERDNALRLAHDVWVTRQLSAEVVPFDRGDALFYRVRAGRFGALREAEEARALLEANFPGAFVVAR
jgi:rare lipoprotein A